MCSSLPQLLHSGTSSLESLDCQGEGFHLPLGTGSLKASGVEGSASPQLRRVTPVTVHRLDTDRLKWKVQGDSRGHHRN